MMKTEHKVLLAFVFLGVFCGLLDGVVIWLVEPTKPLLDVLFFAIGWHEFYVRGFFLIVFTMFGLIAFQEVGKRRRASERVRHLNSALKSIRSLNKRITVEHDPQKLIQAACDALIQDNAYLSAWIALIDEQGEVQDFSSVGLDIPRRELQQCFLETQSAKCLSDIQNRESGTIVRLPERDCPDCPLNLGYPDRAVITARLRIADKNFGMLTVSIPRKYANDPEENALIEDVATDIAAALRRTGLESRVRQSHELQEKTNVRLELATSCAQVGIWEWDMQKDQIYWSPEVKELFGLDLPAEDLSVTAVRESIHPNDVGLWEESVNRCLEMGERHILEMRIKSGEDWKWIRFVGDAARTEDGTPESMIGVVFDITAQKSIQNELFSSRRQLSTLISNLPGIVFRCKNDPDWTMEFLSDGCTRYTGYAPEELIGNENISFNNLILESDREYVWKTIQAALRHNEGYTIEYRIKRKDGELRWVSEIGAPVIDETGEEKIEGFISDITTLKQAQTEVRKSEKRLRTLLDQAPEVAIQGYRADGTVFLWNKASERIYQYKAEEAIGRNLVELIIPPGMVGEVRQLMRAFADGGTPIPSAELNLMRKDGTLVPVYSSHAIVQMPGEPPELFCLDIDLTERRRLEDQLRQSQKMEAIGQLAGGVAHDFNNILQALLGYSQFLVDELPADSRHREYAEEIYAGAERAADLTRQLLAFSRRQMLERRNIDLNQVVESILKMIRRTIGEHINLEFHPCHGDIYIYADRGQMEQVLMNLCVNARDAMPGGGKLTISTESVLISAGEKAGPDLKPGKYVVLGVTDTGTGMDKKTLDQIFEPFFTTKDVGKGTGLGLATVYGIVQQHDGDIHVQSKPGAGTGFHVYLPEVDPMTFVETEQMPQEDLCGTGTILIAEDESSVLRMSQEVLKRSGYTVLTAVDGVEAIKLIDEKKDCLNVAILDLIMPRIGGREVARHLRSLRDNARIIFASGYSAEGEEITAELDGNITLLHKPYRPIDLLRAVKSATMGQDHSES